MDPTTAAPSSSPSLVTSPPTPSGQTPAPNPENQSAGHDSVVAARRLVAATSVCSQKPEPGHARCFALHQNTRASGSGAGPLAGLTPTDLASAYGVPATGGDGVTVAIIDAYDQPHAEQDLNIYRSQFGLPACTTANGCFRKVDQSGGTNYPPTSTSWGGEIDLDIQMVSAICPRCHILLVEARTNSALDLAKAVDEAVSLGASVVSNSYGMDEFASETSLDAYYDKPSVAMFASSGDYGYGAQYPAASPYVVAVGGTSLSRASNLRGWTESAWSAAGSGCSIYEPKPAWQTDSGCSKRSIADISAVADLNTGVAVYDPDYSPAWDVWGGTSVSAPLMAALYAVTYSGSPSDYTAADLYANPGALFDVVSGSNGSCSPSYLCTGASGYDGPTGLGTPNGVGAFMHLTRRIKGTVTGPTSSALAGIWVKATSGGLATSTQTGADGTYSLLVAAGSYQVSFDEDNMAHAAGYYSSSGYVASQAAATPVVVSSADQVGIDVQLPFDHVVHGTITGSNGSGLSGVIVTATAGTRSVGVTTASNGTYTLSLVAGSYTICVRDPANLHQSGCYGSSGFVPGSATASPVVVAGSDLMAIDVQMPTFVHLLGTITAASNGAALSGINLTVNSSGYSTSGVTASGGTYSLLVSPGNYTLAVADPRSIYTSGYYSSGGWVATEAAATPIAVAMADVPGINVAMPKNFNITGATTGYVAVTATSATYTYSTVNKNTSYSVPVPAGSYVISYTDGSGGYATGYYSSTAGYVTDPALATPVVVTNSDVALNTVTPALRLHVSGTVTDVDGHPFAGVHVWNIVAGYTGYAITGADGTYSFGVTSGEDLTLEFVPPTKANMTVWYGASPAWDWRTSPTIHVDNQDVTGINAQLPLNPVMSGVISDTQGLPIANVTVALATCDYSGCGYFDTVTDSGGKYSLQAQPGSYYFEVTDPSHAHVSGYLGSSGFVADKDSRIMIDLGLGGGSVSLQMPVPAHIGGTIRDSGGVPIGGLAIAIQTGYYTYAAGTTTAADGTYSVALPPGTYQVCINKTSTYVGGCLGASGQFAFGHVDFVLGYADVTANGTVASWQTLYGRVTGPTGSPLGGATVQPSNESYPTSVTTAADGTYSILVAPGPTTVSFWKTGLCSGYYSTSGYTWDINAASTLNVTSAAPLTGIDVQLPNYPRVTGVVTGPDGGPLAGVTVQEMVSTSLQGSTTTDAGGHYSLPAPGPFSFNVYFSAPGMIGGYYNGTSTLTTSSSSATTFRPVGPDLIVNVGMAAARAPSAPTGLSATVESGQTTVQWTISSDIGGSGVLEYTATATPGTNKCVVYMWYGTVWNCPITGLTNGQQYTIVVTARNSVGSTPSVPITVTPARLPDLVPGVAAIAGSHRAIVSWSPAPSNGSPITSYTVTSLYTNDGCTAVGTATSCTVTGLTNGASYWFMVTATNGVGAGPHSLASNRVIPSELPAAPVNVTATRGVASASVSWTAVDNATSPVEQYIVMSSPGGKTCSTNGALSCTVSSLTSGQAYTFTVVAVNGAGTGPASNPSAPVTPVDPPGQPTQVTALAGNTSALVSWTAPAFNGGTPIVGYTVTTVGDVQTCTTTALSCLVTGLTNGVSYTFAVTADNGVTTGPPSSPSNAVVPAAVPGKPLNVTGTRGNTAVAVSWQAPLSDGGSPITGYTATASPGGQSCTTTGALSCTVSGLTNGSSYTFTVTAANQSGTSLPSDPLAAVIPATVPGAPSFTGTNNWTSAVTVSWRAPAGNGGLPITGYVVTSTPDGKTCTTTTALSCKVSGLTGGQSYTFQVAAINDVGQGPWSATSWSVPVVGPPGVPTNVQAFGQSGSVLVSWAAAPNGGDAITRYEVSDSANQHGCWTRGDLSCTVTGLSNGTSYQFRVQAVNDLGYGAWSGWSAWVSPSVDLPNQPTGVTAVAGKLSASVSWTAPTFTGSSPISGYAVTSSPGGETCTTSGALSCTVSGLSWGAVYTFTVFATNDSGAGSPSAASNSATPFDVPAVPPGSPVATAGNGSALVKWATPDNHASAITGYTVTDSDGNHACTWTSGPLQCTVTGLTNETAYTFTVTATNAAGTGPSSGPSNAVTPTALPGKPTAVGAIAGPGRAQVSWSVPSFDGGSPITGYVVSSSPPSAGCSTTGATTCTVQGLTKGQTYQFQVQAVTIRGTGPASDWSSNVVPVSVPGKPTGVQANSSGQTVDLTWLAPADMGGLSLQQYTVASTPSSAGCTTATRECLIQNLMPGTTYVFTVVAVNSLGSGSASDGLTVHIDAVAPGKPTNVTSTAGHSQATVQWQAPASNGGSAITGYAVESEPAGHGCSTQGGLTCTVSGLTVGQSYDFTVTASNVAGPGPRSDPSGAIVVLGPVPPGKPTGVTATPGNHLATVTWTAPADDGGAAITTYTVVSNPDNIQCTWTGGPMTCGVTGLTNGQPYTFTVTAGTSVGPGPASDPSNSATPVSPTSSGSTYHAINPARVLDTRATVASGNPTNIGLSGPFVAGTVRTFTVAGARYVGGGASAAIPGNAVAVTGNLTIVGETAPGVIALGPTMRPNGATTTISFVTGDIRATKVTIGLSGGTLSAVYRSSSRGATVNLIFDLTGYFTADTSGSTYHPLAPGRILDSRPSGSGHTNIGLSGNFKNRVVRTISIVGAGALGWSGAQVPGNAVAIIGNLTVTNASSAGYVALGPTMSASPSTSTLNVSAGANIANGVTVALAGGRLQALWCGTIGSTADVLLDVTGYFTNDSSGLAFHAIEPVRLVNSATGVGLSGRFASRIARTFTVAGAGGVPANAVAISGNLTVLGPNSAGWALISPEILGAPTTSTLNANAGHDVANGFDGPLGGAGHVALEWAGTNGSVADLALDVTGYWM